MLKAAILVPAFLFSTTVFSQVEGRVVSFTLDLKGISRNKDVLTVRGTIKSSEFSGGLYFEPRNKSVKIEVPANCMDLAQLAFSKDLPYTIQGEVKRYNEVLTTSSEVTFNERVAVRCDVVKTRN